MGETRVDLQHLLEDLRDAYTGSLEETIVTEIIANALDAGAATIQISVSAPTSALTIVDDGRGMQRRELARYHDIAASTKRRGEGIGFAGVGIKLGLLVSSEVLTETRRASSHVASSWSLTSRYRAPWKWVPPPGLTTTRGTAVRLTLANPLSPLLDAGFLEDAIRRHFEPLFEPVFAAILGRHYSRSVTVHIDGRRLAPIGTTAADVVPVSIRMARRRTPSAVGYLARYDAPLPIERRGIAISTFGKVIKRGWDWLGLTPATSEHVTGLVEVPDLSECLTLNKNDLLRTGARGATYLAYRKALQEAVSRQLIAWSDAPSDAPAAPKPARLDRDLERVLEDLAGEFPLLQALVERRPGGQKRLPIEDGREGSAMRPLFSLIRKAEAGRDAVQTPDELTSVPPASNPSPASDSAPPELPRKPTAEHETAALPGSGTTQRRTQYGLSLQFEARPDDEELGRLVDSTIWVNESHPAYRRALSSRSLGYHLALTVALALAPLAVTPAEEHGFVTKFLAEWGTVSGARTRRGARRQRPSRSRGRAPS